MLFRWKFPILCQCFWQPCLISSFSNFCHYSLNTSKIYKLLTPTKLKIKNRRLSLSLPLSFWTSFRSTYLELRASFQTFVVNLRFRTNAFQTRAFLFIHSWFILLYQLNISSPLKHNHISKQIFYFTIFYPILFYSFYKPIKHLKLLMFGQFVFSKWYLPDLLF